MMGGEFQESGRAFGVQREERTCASFSGRSRTGIRIGRIALAIYVLLMLALLALPIGLVVFASFQGGMEAASRPDGWSLSAYEAVPMHYWDALWFTIKSAFLATICALVLAIPAAWGLVRGNLRERHFVSALVLLPDAVPSITLGIALLALFVPLGLSNSFAGITVALQSGFEGYVPKTRVVLFEAAMAAANGLAMEDALRTITLDAARVIGQEKRIGSLERGKDADLALFDGDPFEFTTHVCTVLINGKIASDQCR